MRGPTAHVGWLLARSLSPDGEIRAIDRKISGSPKVASLLRFAAVKTKLDTLKIAVERYQKSLENLTAMNEELRTLPPSERLSDILEMNEQTMRTTRRLLETAQERLARELDRCAAQANLSPQIA